MHGPDGRDYQNKITYHEVVKPERIVYSHGGGEEVEPVQFRTTVTFEAEGDKTRLTMRGVFPTAAERDRVAREYGAVEGAYQTLERLVEQLQVMPIVVERTFNAPAAVVWKAIVDADQMRQWYFSSIDTFKPEVGFKTQVNVHHDGKDFLHLWKVTDVITGKKIAYSWKYDGRPGDSLVTFELFAEGGKTRLQLTHTGLETFQPQSNPDLAAKNFFKGWTSLIHSSLYKFLENPASSDEPVFTISRTFSAPRALVWKAWTVPELMAKWWGPKGFAVGAYKLDLRPGGTYHYSMRGPDGKDMWGKFTYREITAPEKLVFVSCFSDEKGGITRHPLSPNWPRETLSTITFAEAGGKTTVTIRWTPLNATDEERKTFIEGMAGMNQGWGGTLDQLEAFLATQ